MYSSEQAKIHHGANVENEAVIALHCSGGSAAQWRSLVAQLPEKFTVHCPGYAEASGENKWHGCSPYYLTDEAEPVIKLIDSVVGPIHLLGHSFGGAPALEIARYRPGRLASITLYEPCVFGLSNELPAHALSEIRHIASKVADAVLRGDNNTAMRIFIDFWNGAGSWNSMPAVLQAKLNAWAPKAPLEFSALFSQSIHTDQIQQIECPIALVVGEYAQESITAIADLLTHTVHGIRQLTLSGAGHMGPLTHADEFATLACEHIVQRCSVGQLLPYCPIAPILPGFNSHSPVIPLHCAV